jgi:hypothetical protein
MSELLSRDQFREAVFARDGHKCVHCGKPGVDAHHIIERRLFPNGGYYLNNGVTLCADCHLAAEATLIDCYQLRTDAAILEVVLPEHFFPDGVYDKWGDQIAENGMRMKGELFEEEPVQKVLAPVMHLFTDRIKYPRTMHLPFSPGLQNDDRVLANGTADWEGTEVVITEKLDGEGTTMYKDYLHARSLEFEAHPSREHIKAIHAQIAYEIPEGFRICGENMTAKHSIKYTGLPSYFRVFNIWNRLTCLSWEETNEWCALLNLWTVPVLYQGKYSDGLCQELCSKLDPETQEGLVVRPTRAFHMREYSSVVGKYVRKGHVQTTEHWLRQAIEYNQLG